MDEDEKLANIGYFSIAKTTQRQIGDFTLDPAILLPVELPPGVTSISAGELRLGSHRRGNAEGSRLGSKNPNADYYRRFVLAVKPEIKAEFTQAGIMKARNGESDLAIEIFRALEGLFPDDAVTQMNLALAYEERSRQKERTGRRKGSGGVTKPRLRIVQGRPCRGPHRPAIHYNMAYFYLHQRSFDKAREHLKVFAQTGSDEKRVREAKRLIREIDDQGLMDGLFQQAFDNIRMGKEEDGIAKIKEFLSSRPTVPNAWFLLGWAYRRLARFQEGKEAFLKALSLGSPHADLLNELAICLMELGELAESRKRLEEALVIEPKIRR